jgi:hypothetical protein
MARKPKRPTQIYRILVLIALILSVPAGLVGCIELYEHAERRGWIEWTQD